MIPCRLALFSLAGLACVIAVFCGCALPEMPSQEATGANRLELDPDLEPPVTHVPLEYWRTHHREAVSRGEFPENECQKCHDPDTYCNNCHGYVGVKQIESVAAD